MTTLNLRPESPLASDVDSVLGAPALEQTLLDGQDRGGVTPRAARRRLQATRLRTPGDDGFHLFRVY